ncbi:MAG: hypothetical protein KC457_34820, partial [Myxococcales bacterium]|nr:hypothetical protein [Myxococcales bacterium]
AQAAFEAELEPGDPLALEQWLALVQLELAVGDPAAARVAGSRVVALAEAHHHGSLLQMAALLAQAQALRADGDLAQAMALTMQATRISTPGHSHRHDRRRGEALILGARIAAENGDDDEAQALLTRAEAYLYDGPERALPRLWRGVIELRRRRIPEGLAAIEDGLAIVGELDPEDARALPMLELAGRALLAGAEDGPTRFRARSPEGQTVERHRRPGQGPKKPAVPPALFSLVFPGNMVPQDVPLSLHRLGPLTIAGLPGEFTTVLGMRIRQAIAASDAPGTPRPLLIGLAGEYMS